MGEAQEWDLFEAYCTGVIESVITNQKRTLATYVEVAEMAARIITREAKRRFELIMEEAE